MDLAYATSQPGELKNLSYKGSSHLQLLCLTHLLPHGIPQKRVSRAESLFVPGRWYQGFSECTAFQHCTHSSPVYPGLPVVFHQNWKSKKKTKQNWVVMIYLLMLVFSLQSLHSFRMMESCKILKGVTLQAGPADTIF